MLTPNVRRVSVGLPWQAPATPVRVYLTRCRPKSPCGTRGISGLPRQRLLYRKGAALLHPKKKIRLVAARPDV